MNAPLAPKRRRWLRAGIAGAGLVAVGGAGFVALRHGRRYVPPSVERPEIAGSDVASGAAIDLAGLRGNIVLVEFWATWCGYCLRNLPEVERFAAEYRERGLRVLGVSIDESADELKRFVAQRPPHWPVLRQADARRNFPDVRQVPSFYVVGRDGQTLLRWQGELEGAMRDRLAALFSA
ncbi:TlpA family protein disulfide reductase [Derxia lacustris]|uniref:TlpA family protein disulfide reductase n=1 Tax=Derxia lacustris TaxID=764842 RepID=UPI000A17610B|nr:TlpA disulfide reductase family protein [Derxia lacustris]